MSLQGILDPVVRAYFEKKYGSGETAGGGGYNMYLYDSSVHEIDDIGLYKIANEPPPAEKLQGSYGWFNNQSEPLKWVGGQLSVVEQGFATGLCLYYGDEARALALAVYEDFYADDELMFAKGFYLGGDISGAIVKTSCLFIPA